MQITITEALQEIKTIGKRLIKKRESLGPHLARDTRVRDPLEKDGGAEKFIASERQAISDLENRIIALRTAIQSSNLYSKITVGGTERSVAEWLTWRREISANQVGFLRALVGGIAGFRNDIQKKGGRLISASLVNNTDSFKADDPPQLVVNIDEVSLIREQEQLEKILGDLDGKLSLFNATTVVDA